MAHELVWPDPIRSRDDYMAARDRYNHYSGYENLNHVNARVAAQTRSLRLMHKTVKDVVDEMPKTMTEASSHVEAKKVAVKGLRTLKGFVGLLMLLGLGAVAWGILAGGVLALFGGWGPVAWFVIGGLVTIVISGFCFYGIAVEELPTKLGELASAQAVYDEAVNIVVNKRDS